MFNDQELSTNKTKSKVSTVMSDNGSSDLGSTTTSVEENDMIHRHVLVPCTNLEKQLDSDSDAQVAFLQPIASESINKLLLVPNDAIGHELVHQVVCRLQAAFIVTEPGHVYSVDLGCTFNRPILATGKTVDYETGNRDLYRIHRIDFSIFSPRPRIVQVSAGYSCVFFLCETGRLFYAGSNTTHCIGSMNTSSVANQPTQFDTQMINHERIVTVCCAAYTTCFVTEDPTTGFHNLYYGGSNQFGECSTGTQDQITTGPQRLDPQLFSGHLVKKIVAGDHSFQILTQTGRLFGNGYNSSNQLLLTGAASNQLVTRLTESHPSKNSIVDCASQFYASVVLDSNGCLISSATFQDPSDREMTLEGIHSHDIRSIEAGDRSFAAITHRNTIYWMAQPNFFNTITHKHIFPHLWNAQSMVGKEIRASCDSITAFYLWSPTVSVSRHFPRLNRLRLQGSLADVEFIHSS